ncbi:uncharacterized protein DFL_002388 [Arthrobotrys flagrans]|uniref:Uncharacterized protein n=1 Tax=Arthrobotrys flagrans TaxID=97331 RepID=A0A437AAB3_ARTFL|nr:hypothetical protein DFL_002388 [Arthrobotrys flagrans]
MLSDSSRQQIGCIRKDHLCHRIIAILLERPLVCLKTQSAPLHDLEFEKSPMYSAPISTPWNKSVPPPTL